MEKGGQSDFNSLGLGNPAFSNTPTLQGGGLSSNPPAYPQPATTSGGTNFIPSQPSVTPSGTGDIIRENPGVKVAGIVMLIAGLFIFGTLAAERIYREQQARKRQADAVRR